MSVQTASTAQPTLFTRLSEIRELDRVVDWATRRVTIHPAFADDLRQEILIELTRVKVHAEDPVKLASTVASRISLKFKAQHHGPIKFRDCASANRARRGSVELLPDDADEPDDRSVGDLPSFLAAADHPADTDSPPEVDPDRLASVLDALSHALYRVARHIVRGENAAFIAAAEGMTEASVRTVIHRIHHAIQAISNADQN